MDKDELAQLHIKITNYHSAGVTGWVVDADAQQVEVPVRDIIQF